MLTVHKALVITSHPEFNEDFEWKWKPGLHHSSQYLKERSQALLNLESSSSSVLPNPSLHLHRGALPLGVNFLLLWLKPWDNQLRGRKGSFSAFDFRSFSLWNSYLELLPSAWVSLEHCGRVCGREDYSSHDGSDIECWRKGRERERQALASQYHPQDMPQWSDFPTFYQLPKSCTTSQ